MADGFGVNHLEDFNKVLLQQCYISDNLHQTKVVDVGLVVVLVLDQKVTLQQVSVPRVLVIDIFVIVDISSGFKHDENGHLVLNSLVFSIHSFGEHTTYQISQQIVFLFLCHYFSQLTVQFNQVMQFSFVKQVKWH